MSRRKKKLRNPSPAAVAEFAKKREEQVNAEKATREAHHKEQMAGKAVQEEWDKLDPAERLRREDEAWLNELAPETRAKWAEAGNILHERSKRLFTQPKGDVTEEEIVSSLDVCTRFLTQLVDAAGEVLETLDRDALRKIVAADVPLTETMRKALKAAGVAVDQNTSSPAQDSSPQKRPRGSRHPLMAFFALAVQASRLVQQITKGSCPHAHNLFSREEKIDRQEARQSDVMNAAMRIKEVERLQKKSKAT